MIITNLRPSPIALLNRRLGKLADHETIRSEDYLSCNFDLYVSKICTYELEIFHAN